MSERQKRLKHRSDAMQRTENAKAKRRENELAVGTPYETSRRGLPANRGTSYPSTRQQPRKRASMTLKAMETQLSMQMMEEDRQWAREAANRETLRDNLRSRAAMRARLCMASGQHVSDMTKAALEWQTSMAPNEILSGPIDREAMRTTRRRERTPHGRGLSVQEQRHSSCKLSKDVRQELDTVAGIKKAPVVDMQAKSVDRRLAIVRSYRDHLYRQSRGMRTSTPDLIRVADLNKPRPVAAEPPAVGRLVALLSGTHDPRHLASRVGEAEREGAGGMRQLDSTTTWDKTHGAARLRLESSFRRKGVTTCEGGPRGVGEARFATRLVTLGNPDTEEGVDSESEGIPSESDGEYESGGEGTPSRRRGRGKGPEEAGPLDEIARFERNLSRRAHATVHLDSDRHNGYRDRHGDM
ncbi:hypothetical protein KIPB_007640 [Kipferlia bialata]|uniref:Uncharacterized protein n=1 Tax=Kipferlia bialata TaxID=797122 RepID=A0A9K3D226_9EUKA|nr:hypothetical protein KIPB_007640 [Kipferlia bialata]|eukprot:g7640.t1